MSNKLRTAKIIKLVFSIVLCLVLIFFIPGGFFSPVRKIALGAAYPFQKTFYLLSRKADETLSFFGSISKLKEENERLIRENNIQVAELAALRDQQNENSTLREQLKLAPKDKYDLIASFVIGQDPQKSGSWILIDKGSLDGISEDLPVIVSEGILVGRISEVGLASSKVSLLSDSQSAINCYDLETGARGIIHGEYGLGLVLDMVNQADVVNKGDTIVTSGLGSDMPRGFFVGKVDGVKMTDDKLFQQASIIPRAKYAKLDIVMVVKNTK